MARITYRKCARLIAQNAVNEKRHFRKEALMATRLPKDYVPSDDEPFMNARQREYFRRKLMDWKDDLIKGTQRNRHGLAK